MFRITASFAAWVLSASWLFGQNVWVVDDGGGPGADFAEVNLAVAAAADGDFILVRPGVYWNHVAIAAKSLTIQAFLEPGGSAPEIESLEVRDLTASQRVVLRGVRFGGSAFGGLFLLPGYLSIRNSAGAVIVEDSGTHPGETIFLEGPALQPTLRIEDSSRVLLQRCYFRGEHGAILGFGVSTPPASALRIVNSTVSAYACDFVGGPGADAFKPVAVVLPAQDGATGVHLVSGTLFAAGCELSGGKGGDGILDGAVCWPSGDGGTGLVAGGAMKRMDTAIQGGAPGVDAPGCPQVGVAGEDIQLAGGSIAVIAETLRSLTVSAPGVEGQSVNTTVQGVPGEAAILLVSFAPRVEFFSSLKGTLAGDFPLISIGLGPLPASGVLSFDIVLPTNLLPPGVGALHLYEQVVVPGSAGTGLLSSPSVTVLVDDAL